MNNSEVNSRLNIGKNTNQAKKVYNIISITYDLFEVILYENGIEVDEYTIYPENLDKLVEKIEADGYAYEDFDEDDD